MLYALVCLLPLALAPTASVTTTTTAEVEGLDGSFCMQVEYTGPAMCDMAFSTGYESTPCSATTLCPEAWTATEAETEAALLALCDTVTITSYCTGDYLDITDITPETPGTSCTSNSDCADFCNFDDGTSGTCEYCGNIAGTCAEDEFENPAGTAACEETCESDGSCTSHEDCPDSYCYDLGLYMGGDASGVTSCGSAPSYCCSCKDNDSIDGTCPGADCDALCAPGAVIEYDTACTAHTDCVNVLSEHDGENMGDTYCLDIGKHETGVASGDGICSHALLPCCSCMDNDSIDGTCPDTIDCAALCASGAMIEHQTECTAHSDCVNVLSEDDGSAIGDTYCYDQGIYDSGVASGEMYCGSKAAYCCSCIDDDPFNGECPANADCDNACAAVENTCADSCAEGEGIGSCEAFLTSMNTGCRSSCDMATKLYLCENLMTGCDCSAYVETPADDSTGDDGAGNSGSNSGVSTFALIVPMMIGAFYW